MYYEKILTDIQNEEVRNITLTRKVINLLSTGFSSAEFLFKKYLNDCSNSDYKNIATKYYNDYVSLKNYSKKNFKINQLHGSLFEELNVHRGKVLYIDFWASWCVPCIEGIPYSKKVQEKYQNEALEIVYINIDDNIGRAQTMAIKLGLEGTLIFLNKEQSDEIRKN